MQKQYRIKNWAKFQHFRDRRPPWIKLYRDLLDDIEWHELDAPAAKALVSLWLLAAETEGILPDSKTIAFRLRIPEKSIESIVSKLTHWLYHLDIIAISQRYQDDPLEREVETEVETEQTLPSSPDECPDCPATEIVETYHQTLPTLTRVVALNTARQSMLRGRWREMFQAGDFKTQPEGVKCFRDYFAYAGKSPFLTGQVNGNGNGRKPFLADFEWLIRPQNFLKVLEGKYHGSH